MRALVSTLVVLALGAFGARSAWPEEVPLSPQEVAAQVKAAHEAAETDRIATWARKDAPDPWLVTDALLASGAREAAKAFAIAAPRKDVERLPELVARWKAIEGDAAGRRALEAGNAALLAQKHAEALAAFEAARAGATPLVAVRLTHGRGIALLRLRRATEAALRFEEVATSAEQLGWLVRAAAALLDLTLAEHAAERPEAALAAAQRLLALETSRGIAARVAEAHMLIGRVSRGRPTQAIESFERALALEEKAGDPQRIVGVVFELGRRYGDRGEPGDQEKALELHLRAQRIYESLGNRRGAVAALSNAADSSFRLGRDAVAKEQADRVVVLARELDLPWLEGRGLHLLGELAERARLPEQALAAFTAAAGRFEAAGDRVEAARCVAGAAEASRVLGDLPKAREQGDRALREAEALHDTGVLAYALLVAAHTRRDQGLREEALVLARRSLEAYRAVRNAWAATKVQALIRELEPAAPR